MLTALIYNNKKLSKYKVVKLQNNKPTNLSIYTVSHIGKLAKTYNNILKFNSFFLVNISNLTLNNFFNAITPVIQDNLKKGNNFYIFSKIPFFNLF